MEKGAESRVHGWSGRRDQVGGWGQRRVGGYEEAESRQQEAGRGGVDKVRRERGGEREKAREMRRDCSSLYRTCSSGERPCRIKTSSP